ncbi:MAG TPA: hypothetical protein VMT27_03325 [Actinomycetes bacterium]|nr:hypothetical protein [Actinomycetes bacterium]
MKSEVLPLGPDQTTQHLPGVKSDLTGPRTRQVALRGGFDLITMVAVLHPLQADSVLVQARQLLAPGDGRG